MENGNHQKVRGDQTVHAVSARFRKTRGYTKVVCFVLNLCTRFFHRKVRGDQILHAVSARFRKTRRYTKVVCCVLNLCTRFFHQKVQGDQILHAMSARFRKTRRYTKVVCCVLNLCTRFFHQKIRGDQTIHAVSARIRKTRRYTTRNPPLFVVSTPRNGPTRRVDPRTSGHLVQSEGSPARARWGPTVGPSGSPGRKKSFFPKLFPDHLGCSNTCFWPVLSPWWRVLGHGKSQNALKMGRFGTNNGSKMGQKRVFPKVILDHLWCSNKWF